MVMHAVKYINKSAIAEYLMMSVAIKDLNRYCVCMPTWPDTCFNQDECLDLQNPSGLVIHSRTYQHP